MPLAEASAIHLAAAICISCRQHWDPETVHGLPFCAAGDIPDLHGADALLSLLRSVIALGTGGEYEPFLPRVQQLTEAIAQTVLYPTQSAPSPACPETSIVSVHQVTYVSAATLAMCEAMCNIIGGTLRTSHRLQLSLL